jgi:hypothetical protein
VFPLFSAGADTEGAFKQLFTLLAVLLLVVRLNAAWVLRDTLHPEVVAPTARVTALVHVVEAIYYSQVVFGEHGTLPTRLDRLTLARHGEAALVYAVILANAALFTAWWLRARGEAAALKDRVAARRADASAVGSGGKKEA